MSGALSGLRVVELGDGKGIAAAGSLLRALGADVIKIEPPGGDRLRTYGPFPGDKPHPEHSGLFIYLNGGKRGATLDLERPQSREMLHRLLEGTDVLLHSYAPAAAKRLGLEANELLDRSPRLIVTALTPYGSTGPYADWRGYPIQAQAGSGVAIRTGDPDREPLTAPLDQGETQHAAVQAAVATVLALVHRNRVGRGQFVDISVMEAVAIATGGMGFQAVLYQNSLVIRRRGRRFGAGPWGIYRTKDGAFDAITQQNRQWLRFLDLIGDPDWAREEAFRDVRPRFTAPRTAEHVERWREELTKWFGERTTDEVWNLTREYRISFQPVHTIGQVVDSDHIAARRFMVDAPGPHPPLRVPGAPYRLSATPWEPPGPPPPIDSSSDVGWSGPPAADPDLAPPPTDQRLPLEGLRVIDLSQVWAGPLLVRYLADYGADVIIVETAARPRELAPISDMDSPARWESLYRNRRSVNLDLRKPEAVRLLKGLLARADVLVDNFTPRVMPNFGLPYEDVAKEFPHLIIAALSATGRDGPWSDLLTYGPALTALYGSKSLNGYPPDEVMEDVADLDPVSAGYGMLAIMAALNHRDRTGEGQFIEIAQGEVALRGVAEAAIEHVWNGREIGPQGNTHRLLAPHGFYPCDGEDQWIAIACGSDEEWHVLAGIADHPEWLERPEFADAHGRCLHRAEIDAEIAAWTRPNEAGTLTQKLQAAGVAALPAMTTLDMISDPQHSHRRAHFRLGETFAGGALFDHNPWHLSIASPLLRHKAPEPGADSDEVFRELLNLSDQEISRYREEGVIG